MFRTKLISQHGNVKILETGNCIANIFVAMGLTDYLARARIFSLLSQNNSSNIRFTSYINHLIVLDILRFISSHKDRFFYYVCRILNSLHTDYNKMFRIDSCKSFIC